MNLSIQAGKLIGKRKPSFHRDTTGRRPVVGDDEDFGAFFHSVKDI
jgi:hypothetical protein